ncbi:MAG: transposase domain-containing protein [Planctomycetes bacterium]|nr:transposase domain-containing protein [Planctomycetota bacterium]
MLGIPPFEYLRDVLSRISTHPHRLIHELTPAGWKARARGRSDQERVTGRSASVRSRASVAAGRAARTERMPTGLRRHRRHGG